MLVECKAIKSLVNDKNLGLSGRGLTVGKKYLVLGLIIDVTGLNQIIIRNDDYDCDYPCDGVGIYDGNLFEVVDGNISQYWIISQWGNKSITCPKEWTYNDFWDEFNDGGYGKAKKYFNAMCKLMELEYSPTKLQYLEDH